MILEMHCHTAEHSGCSTVSAAEVVRHNFDIGLQGTVLTDHHYLWPPGEIAELRRRIKVPDYYLVLSGQEIDTPELGDVLVYGAGVLFEKGTSLETIRKHFPGAAIIWAHPYRHENIPSREKLFHSLIDGIEIFSSNLMFPQNLRVSSFCKRIAGRDSDAAAFSNYQIGDPFAAGFDRIDQSIHKFRTGITTRKITLMGHHQIRLDQRAPPGAHTQFIHPIQQDGFDSLRFIGFAMFENNFLDHFSRQGRTIPDCNPAYYRNPRFLRCCQYHSDDVTGTILYIRAA